MSDSTQVYEFGGDIYESTDELLAALARVENWRRGARCDYMRGLRLRLK